MVVILWALVVVLAAGLAYMFWQNYSLRRPEAQTKLAEEASQSVISSVSKLIIVPEDKPTVATITDVNKLRTANESFYKNAKNGDTLLLYSTVAIIFRSSENKIVNVAPVVVSPEADSAGASDDKADDKTDGTAGDSAADSTGTGTDDETTF